MQAYNIQTRNIGDNYVTLLQIQPSAAALKANVKRRSVETKKVVTDYGLLDQSMFQNISIKGKKKKGRSKRKAMRNQTVILTSEEN